MRFHVRARRCVEGGRRAHVSQVAQVCPSSAASRQRENRAHVTEPARARGTWVCYLERTVGTTRERRGSAPSHSSSLPSSHWLLLLISSLPSKSSAPVWSKFLKECIKSEMIFFSPFLTTLFLFQLHKDIAHRQYLNITNATH